MSIDNARGGPQGVNTRSPSLAQALDNAGISVVYQDRALVVVWARNVPSHWMRGELAGLTDSDFLPADEAERTTAAKRDVLETGRPAGLEIVIAGPDGPHWFKLWIDADSPDGRATGVVTTAVDITEQKQREQTLRALLREVSHRSKNLLAIIQSVANQTGRFSGSVEVFLTRFRGRLQSLASSQDLVTSSNWRGADLHELAYAQIGRYVTEPTRSVGIDGASPFLNPNAALHIGLAFHELAVNSVSYGALSRREGRVAIGARIVDGLEDETTRGQLVLTWREAIPPDFDPLRNRRFGSIALERVVPASLDGTARLTASDGLLEYYLAVPAGSFEDE
ncbi:MAG: sensor histidine kinase [Rhizobiaceae bacterium]